jgi:hypothetical protein
MDSSSLNSSIETGFDVNNNEAVNDEYSSINKNLQFNDTNDKSPASDITLSPSISSRQHSPPLVILNDLSNNRSNPSQRHTSTS